MRLIVQRGILIFMLCLIGLIAFSGNVVAQDEEIFFGLALLTIILICSVIAIIIAVLIGVWVYQDANSRGMNGTLWLILVILGAFIGGPIGLIIVIVIYIVVRDDQLDVPLSPPYRHEREYPTFKEPSLKTSPKTITEQTAVEVEEGETIRCPVCKELSLIRTKKRPIEIKCPNCGAEGELTD